MSTPYRLVRSRAELERVADEWCSLPAVAIDTEFVHETTFWPRPGLVQVATGNEVVLVDAVAVGDLSALGPLLDAAAPCKVVHAGAGDAALLEHAAGRRPAPLFDTQVAAAFCGLGTSLSYAALVRELLGVELAKSETRTDWTRRPLSREQLAYAAEDVQHLLEVAALLERRLAELGRTTWVTEESQAASAADPTRVDPELAWKRVRGTERFAADARRVVAALARWRELEARRLDLPRTFVLRDESLREIARRQISEPEALRKVRGFDPRRHGRFVAAILATVGGALACDRTPPLPAASVSKGLDRAAATAVAALGERLALPPELLLSRRARERLLCGLAPGELPSSRLEGWRRDVLGPVLDAVTGESSPPSG